MGFFPGYDTSQSVSVDSGSRKEVIWYVNETSNETIAKDTAEAGLPPTEGLLVLDSFTVDRLANELFEVRATYIDPDDEEHDEKPDLGEVVVSFDTTGGTQHITCSKAGDTQRYAAAGVTARDFKGSIGVTESSVEGVDILAPALRITMQVRVAGGSITDAYVKDLARLTGKVNNAAFKGYAAGELLFLGANGQQKVGAGDPTITYEFEASENVVGLTYTDYQGNNINVASKGGHEYLWVSFADTEDAAAKTVTQRPHTVFVETVYESADFSLLGIGT